MASAAGRPSVLLFDLGGVLVRVRGFASLTSLVEGAAGSWSGSDDALKARWLASSSVRSFELGQIPLGVFAERFVAEWELDMEPAAFAEDLTTWIVGPFPGAQQLVADLQARGYHVSCFSNCNALHWEEMSPFLSLLDSAFSSHLLARIKPDESAFRAVIDRLGVEPREIVFFDDSRPNIEAAERLGLRSFLVNGAEACRAALEAEGLL